MSLFKPTIYKKDIFNIDYNNLKEKGIKCLVFDLDNTLGLIDNKKCPRKTKKLLKELKKDFLILICSNIFLDTSTTLPLLLMFPFESIKLLLLS